MFICVAHSSNVCMFRNRIQRSLSSPASNTPKKYNISGKATLFTAVVGSGIAYLIMQKNKQPHSQLDPSDPLRKFQPLPYSTVNTLLQQHQTLNSVSPRITAKGTALYRYDTSTINSNTPSEDRHTEHQHDGKYIFG